MNTNYHVRGERLIAIGAGLVLGAGSACSLLTTLDAPTSDTPPSVDAAFTEDASALGDASDASTDAIVDVAALPDDVAVPDACTGDAAPPYFAATYVDQSFPLATTPLTMIQGQVIPSYITLQNTGTTPWTSGTRLGTTEPENRTSPFADSTWLSPDRASAVVGVILPGASFKFQFDLEAPSTTGTYFEHYNLVDESSWHCGKPRIWFSDTGQGGPADDDIEVQIVVTPGDGG